MDFLFTFLILENVFERYLPFLSYTDEIITIVCLVYLIFKLFRVKIHKYYWIILLSFFGVLLMGMFSSLTNLVQTSPIAIMKDILAISKFFIVYIFSALFIRTADKGRVIHHITIFTKVFIWVLFVFALVNEFFSIGMDSGYRGHIKVFTFLYSHSTFMVASVVVLCSILIAQGFKKNFIYLLLAAIVLIFSMRIKAYIFIISILVLLVLLKSKQEFGQDYIFSVKMKRRIYTSLVILAIFAYFIAKTKINDYFMWGMVAARPALYIVGFEILKNYFPLGSGFATFASSISGDYYSPLYFQYGISNISGLQQGKGYEYIADTYWPYIYAQFGLFGALFYVLSLFYVFKNILRVYKSSANGLVAAIALFIYVVAGCFVESMLTNSSIVLVALVLGYYLRIITTENDLNK